MKNRKYVRRLNSAAVELARSKGDSVRRKTDPQYARKCQWDEIRKVLGQDQP